MTTYAKERIFINDTVPVGFSDAILNPSSLIRPKTAFGRVEGANIRAGTQGGLDTGDGMPVFVNEPIELDCEQDIEHFQAICTEAGKTASIYFEITE